MPRKPRRRSWGSITERVKGKKYVLRWVENTPDGRRRRCETFHGTYREASLRLDELHVRHGDDKPVPSIGQVYEMWYLPSLKDDVRNGRAKQNTLDTYENIWRKWVRPAWGGCPVDSVRAMDVQEWLMTMPKATAVTSLSIVRKVMDVAVRYEYAQVNKFRGVFTMPTRQAMSRDRTVYSLADADAMLDRLAGSRIEGAFIAACFGGARTGESLGVTAEEVEYVNVDGLDLALVPIRRRTGVRDELMPDGDLKNKQSERTTVIPGRYSRALRAVAERSETGLLTYTVEGLPMGTAHVNAEWKRAAGDMAIPFANLRNSWRTFAQMEWGIDWDTLESLMGHTLPGVTGKHYIRPSAMQLAERFAALYRGDR